MNLFLSVNAQIKAVDQLVPPWLNFIFSSTTVNLGNERGNTGRIEELHEAAIPCSRNYDRYSSLDRIQGGKFEEIRTN